MKKDLYNQYKFKKNNILNRFKEINIDEIILIYLKLQNYDIKNKNVIYIVEMIKKVLFNEMMFGKEFSNKIIEQNSLYLFNIFVNSSIYETKYKIYNFLEENKIDEDLNTFIMKVANSINEYIKGLNQIEYVYYKK